MSSASFLIPPRWVEDCVSLYLAISYQLKNPHQSWGWRTPYFHLSVFACLFYCLSWFHSGCDFNIFWKLCGNALCLKPSQVSTRDPGSLESVPTPSLTSPYVIWHIAQCLGFPQLHQWHWLVTQCYFMSSSNQAPAVTTLEPWSGFSSTLSFQ